MIAFFCSMDKASMAAWAAVGVTSAAASEFVDS